MGWNTGNGVAGGGAGIAATARPSANVSAAGYLGNLVAQSDPSGLVSADRISAPEAGIYDARFAFRLSSVTTYTQIGIHWFDGSGTLLWADYQNGKDLIGGTQYGVMSGSNYLPAGGYAKFYVTADYSWTLYAADSQVSFARSG